MTTLTFTYMEAIGEGFPTVGCHCAGTGDIYENIVWDSGDPIPPKVDVDIWIIGHIKDHMWKSIQAERDRRKSGGVKVGTDWFHSDDTSRIQQLALVMMGAGMPTGIMWKTMSGSFVSMTPTLAGQIFQSIAAADMGIFSKAEQLKAALYASADPGNFDYKSGWPLTFGE